ncbi:LAGLIDADG family homing endonuclease [Candidatus Giovannonibacteria bacterium]|nr:LAGLIDADG family homing endonuclease [Candidatus Giovannonibacteria bacterium]
MDILPEEYIVGFVDGEGCFSINFRKDVRHERTNKPIYYSWKIQFSIVLRKDDIEILKRIRATLDCGSISIGERGFARYQVTDVRELYEKIMPFFEKNNLQAKKRFDFELWKEALEIIFRTKRKEINARPGVSGFVKTNWIKEDLERLESINQELIGLRQILKPHKWVGNRSSAL